VTTHTPSRASAQNTSDVTTSHAVPHIYVINLDGSDARLAAVQVQLDAAQLSHSRVAAVDGRGKPASAMPEYDEREAMRYIGRHMLGGEVACFLSHVKCAQLLLQSDAQFALVVEDDVVLHPDFATHVAAALHWLEAHPEQSWDVINVGCSAIKFATPLHRLGQQTLFHAHYFAMSTLCLLWSRHGAAQFVAASNRIFAPVDVYLRFAQTRSGRGLAIYPPLVRQVIGAGSEIDTSTVPRYHSSRRGLPYFLRKQRRTLGGNMIALQGYIRAMLRRRGLK
jgi:glycosyl transferase, family 25